MMHNGIANVMACRARALGNISTSCARLDWCMQAEIREKLTSMYSASSVDCVSVFGFRTQVRLHACLRHASATSWHCTWSVRPLRPSWLLLVARSATSVCQAKR